jgi:hypothetical protein
LVEGRGDYHRLLKATAGLELLLLGRCLAHLGFRFEITGGGQERRADVFLKNKYAKEFLGGGPRHKSETKHRPFHSFFLSQFLGTPIPSYRVPPLPSEYSSVYVCRSFSNPSRPTD